MAADFAAANTQVFGVSIDSVYCHANWANSLGGVAIPLLSDFHPKGAVAASFGMYLGDKGITDRATVIIDAGGIVRHASSVTPAGKRDMNELLAEVQKIDAAYDGPTEGIAAPGLAADAVMYVKSSCGFSANALMAANNLHANLTVRNISEDADAKAAFEATGATTVPCLVTGGETIAESADIIKHLAHALTGH